jgi:hypothetical protein
MPRTSGLIEGRTCSARAREEGHTDVETITNEALDLIVFADDEATCEPQDYHLGITCSVQATHRLTFACDPDSMLVCAHLAGLIMGWRLDPENDCEDCDRLLSECWKVIPV